TGSLDGGTGFVMEPVAVATPRESGRLPACAACLLLLPRVLPRGRAGAGDAARVAGGVVLLRGDPGGSRVRRGLLLGGRLDFRGRHRPGHDLVEHAVGADDVRGLADRDQATVPGHLAADRVLGTV